MYKNINLQFLISYIGFLPYLIVIIDKFFFQQIDTKILESFSVYYTIIILVFIGSINWNLEEKVSKKRVLYSRPRSSQNSLAKKVVKIYNPKYAKITIFR